MKIKIYVACFLAVLTVILCAIPVSAIESEATVSVNRVLSVTKHPSSEIVHVTTSGNKSLNETINTTPEHPFYVPAKGWTSAVNLRTGDVLYTLNGEYIVVEQVQHEILEKPVWVYNFEVAEDHTYFVGENAVGVHNDCNTRMTTVQATKAAELLGYKKVKGNFSHSEAVYTNGKYYISPDNRSHIGGVWKMARSIEDLFRKETRMGTYDANLNWIGK